MSNLPVKANMNTIGIVMQRHMDSKLSKKVLSVRVPVATMSLLENWAKSLEVSLPDLVNYVLVNVPNRYICDIGV